MTTKTTHQKLAGFSISPGLGIGNAYLYSDGSHRFQVVYKIGPGEVAAEARRVKKAFRQVLQDLEHSKSEVKRNLDEDFARIFHMHQEMLKDPSLYDEIREMIEQTRLNAEFVVTAIFQRQEERLLKAGNGGMAHGAGDISDLSKRVLCVLTGEDANQLANLPQGTVVVAKQLLPSDTVHFSRRSISGVVIEYGGSTSHAAILTRELGIPAVSGIEDVVQKISNGQILLVDGEDGTVTVEPNKAEKETVRRRLKEISSQRARVKELANKPATTRDGVTVKVMANISCREDAALAAQYGADGVGLHRVEHLYFGRVSLPTEDELIEAIRHTLAPFDNDTPVTLRLLDTGGDKPLPFLDYPDEAAPLMGRRGVRFLLHFPELLTTQLRAFLRLSQERAIRVLVPMVTVAEDMKAVRARFQELAKELSLTHVPPLGSMIETPAAALCADTIAKHSDFLSTGTNDLTQYTMAAGRENPHVDQYFIEHHPAILRLLREMFHRAGNQPIGICGELASQTDAVRSLLALGARELSVSPLRIPDIKEAIRRVDLSEIPKIEHFEMYKTKGKEDLTC